MIKELIQNIETLQGLMVAYVTNGREDEQPKEYILPVGRGATMQRISRSMLGSIKIGRIMDKYKNKYRIESTRLKNWDYGWNAEYFVTICTHNRTCFFGNIINGIAHLSPIGKIAEKYWYEIPKHFPFVTLGAFVVMPNHIHGIIIINKTDTDTDTVETPKLGVSTTNPNTTYNASQKWKSGSLGAIINQYKRIVTINARKINSDFGWQSRFHDHIIRNEKSFNQISEYIINNPLNWNKDNLYYE